MIPHRAYDSAINGFAADLSVAEQAALRADPRVTMVAPDRSRLSIPPSESATDRLGPATLGLTGRALSPIEARVPQGLPRGIRRIGATESPTAGIDSRGPDANIDVANMSFAGPGVDDGNCGRAIGDPIHLAICRATAAGVVLVAAAGNESVDAATLVPTASEFYSSARSAIRSS